MNFRRRIGLVDDGAELRVIDKLFILVRRQRHRRLEQRLARHDVVAAGKVFAQAAQVDAGENDLRPGGPDIDADAVERDMVLQPKWVVLQPLVVLDPIMIVVGAAFMNVSEVLAVDMVRERVAVRFFWVVGGRHRGSYHAQSLARPRPLPTCLKLWKTRLCRDDFSR